jgi:hypothetical protein
MSHVVINPKDTTYVLEGGYGHDYFMGAQRYATSKKEKEMKGVCVCRKISLEIRGVGRTRQGSERGEGNSIKIGIWHCHRQRKLMEMEATHREKVPPYRH